MKWKWHPNFLKTVGFRQKYSDIKTPAGVSILKRAVLNQASNFFYNLQFVMSQIQENNFVVQTSSSL